MDNEIDVRRRRLMATTGMSKAEATVTMGDSPSVLEETESDATSAELAKSKEARPTKEPKAKPK